MSDPLYFIIHAKFIWNGIKMSLFESKDYEKLYDGFNSQERDFNPSLPPLPLCQGGRTTVKEC